MIVKTYKISPAGRYDKVSLKRYTSGAYKPNNNEPTVWFDSIESMAQVLSSKNQELLKKIGDNNPESLAGRLAIYPER